MEDILKRDIRYLKGVGEKRAELFSKLGVFSVGDLLHFYPRRYIDYSSFTDLLSAPFDTACVVKAMVLQKKPVVRLSNNRTLFNVICADENAKLTVSFFNSEYTVQKLNIGEEYLFYGKITGGFTNKQMMSPLFINANSPITQEAIYNKTKGLSDTIIQNCIKQAFSLVDDLEDFIDDDILNKHSLPTLFKAVNDIHFAKSNTDLLNAKNRLIFNELLILQLGLGLLGNIQKQEKSQKIAPVNIDEFYKSLSFIPTNAQKKAINEIIADFQSGSSMNRMLQGDVGSGKTLVGVSAMFIMAKNNIQSCMMAPTEILAIQHYHSISKMLSCFSIRCALLTSSTKAKEKKEIHKSLENGDIDVLIGTHAVLNEKTKFNNLGLCITDEQHRFGVRQRNLISQKGDNPHILVMSATPIPRSLAMTIYANLKVSVLDEMPVGRKPILTYLVGTDKRQRMFNFIKENIDNSSQVYIVLPAIEEGENLSVEMQNVTNYYNDVVLKLLPDVKSAMLHGKMKNKEKEQIMQDFKDGKLELICSTTVIEVGVDVPNATLMIIENAERYGLSALHQLRGRVGRGQKQSYCILVSDSNSSNAKNRLKFITTTQNGFLISQYDLDNRGPGDFFGDRQHGLPTLKLAQLSEDLTILNIAQEESINLLCEDNNLSKHPLIKSLVEKLFTNLSL